MFNKFDTVKIISFSSGKGGVGKTFLASNISILLAESNRNTILVDSDMDGSNIRNVFRIKKVKYSLSDYFKGKCSLEETLVKSKTPKLKLIPNSSEFIYTLALDNKIKSKFFKDLRQLKCDNLILDLGSGTHEKVIDPFLLSESKCVVFNSEPTSIENLYALLKNSLLRILYLISKNSDVLRTYIQEEEKNSINFGNFCDEIKVISPDLYEKFETYKNSFQLKLIANFIDSEKDIEVANRLKNALKKFLKLDCEIIGYLPYSKEVPDSIKSMNPLAYNENSEIRKVLQSFFFKLL